MLDAYSYCEQLVREADKDRYLATLFLPAEKRPHLFALYAFNVEIASIRERVAEPMAGEIRLQWWKDAFAGGARGDAGGNPVAAALLSTIDRCGLSSEALLALLEARSFDLYNDVMQTREAFEGYLRATACSLFELSGTVAGGDSAAIVPAAASAGKAYGVTGLLRAFPLHASRGQIFLPASVMNEHGVQLDTILAGRSTDSLDRALAQFRDEARHFLKEAQINIDGLPTSAKLAFLPISLTNDYLSQMDRPGYDPFKTPVDVPQWKRQWRLWRAARGAG